jgi:hypothetical protein
MENPQIPVNPPTLADMALHLASIAIANAYTTVYAINPQTNAIDDNLGQDMILAYRNVRRHINKGPDGKRYGHDAAYKAMQGRM